MTTIALVEKIKRILSDPEGITEEELRALASEYASRCRRVNDKLGRAASCIRAGALCEADRVERDGNLLQEYQTLAFENSGEWREVCRSLGCDVTARLSDENGAELQMFVFSFDESRELFARHRFLATTGASVAERLDVLYQIAVKFSQYPTIVRQIETLERERVNEIERALNDPEKGKEPGFIDAAVAELTAPERLTPAPASLLKKLQAKGRSRQTEQAAAALRLVLDDWANAKLSNSNAKMIEILKYYRSNGYAKYAGLLLPDEREALNVLERESIALERQSKIEANAARRAAQNGAEYRAGSAELEKKGKSASSGSSRGSSRRSSRGKEKTKRKKNAKLPLIVGLSVGAATIAIVLTVALCGAKDGNKKNDPAPHASNSGARNDLAQDASKSAAGSKDAKDAAGAKETNAPDADVDLDADLDAELDESAANPSKKTQTEKNDETSELTSAIGVVKTYKDALKKLAVSDEVAVAQLAEGALDDVEIARTIEIWNRCFDEHKTRSSWIADQEAYEAVAAAVADDSEYKIVPGFEDVKTAVESFKDLGNAGGLESARDTLAAALDRFQEKSYLYYDEGKYVYLTSDPNDKETGASDELERLTSAGEAAAYDLSSAPAERVETIGLSAQYQVFSEAKDRGVLETQDAFEFCDFALNNVKMLASKPSEELDPGVNLVLLNGFTKALAPFPGGDKLAARFNDAAGDFDFDYQFYSFDEQKANASNAEAALQKFAGDDLGALCGEIEETLRAALEASAAPTFPWIGYIDVVGGIPRVQIGDEAPSEGDELWVFRAEDDPVKCGTWRNGASKLNGDRDWDEYRFTPVYARKIAE